MKKRCQKGKSCGASCISKSKICRKDLREVSKEIPKIKTTVQTRKETSGPPSFKPHSKSTGSGESGMGKVKQALGIFSDPAVEKTDITGVVSPDKVNWEAGIGKGARFDAKGAYGAFVDVPPDRLAKGLKDKFPDGVGVKYGRVTEREVELLKLAGESGASPRMISARLAPVGLGVNQDFALPGERLGMIAMERVPGLTLRKNYSDGSLSREDLSDKYITGIAKLHRAGISHGDAHLGNAILQPNGQVKFIDLGRAIRKPSEALYEALRATSLSMAPFYGFGGGLSGPVSEKLRSNLERIRDSGQMAKYNALRGEARERGAEEIIKELYRGI